MKVWHKKGVHTPSKQRVAICTPTYGGLCAEYTVSLYEAQAFLTKKGIYNELMIYAGNCHVDDSRNRLVRDFLDSSCNQMIFIDADMRFRGQDLYNLIMFDRDVIGGTYPLKQDKEGYPVRFFDGEIVAEEDGAIEVEAVPTGFLKIKREVFEKLADISPGFKSKDDRLEARKIPLIFERLLDGSQRWGGDYAFCKKWRDIGGKIYLAPDFVFGHIGDSEWTGSVSEYLLRVNGLQDSYIEVELNKLKNGLEVDYEALRKAWGNDWAVSTKFLTTLSILAEEATTSILELGSGLTTLILGAITKQQVFVLEQNLEWAKKAQEWVGKMGWDHVFIYHCDIIEYDGFQWFDIPENLPSFDLVICDAPTRDIGRGGMKSVVGNKLKKGCKIMIDDIHTEESALKEWGYKYNKFGDFAIAEV